MGGWEAAERAQPVTLPAVKQKPIKVLSPLRRAYKTIEDDDLKFPLIYGEGKKVRSAAARLPACPLCGPRSTPRLGAPSVTRGERALAPPAVTTWSLFIMPSVELEKYCGFSRCCQGVFLFLTQGRQVCELSE